MERRAGATHQSSRPFGAFPPIRLLAAAAASQAAARSLSRAAAAWHALQADLCPRSQSAFWQGPPQYLWVSGHECEGNGVSARTPNRTKLACSPRSSW